MEPSARPDEVGHGQWRALVFEPQIYGAAGGLEFGVQAVVEVGLLVTRRTGVHGQGEHGRQQRQRRHATHARQERLGHGRAVYCSVRGGGKRDSTVTRGEDYPGEGGDAAIRSRAQVVPFPQLPGPANARRR